MSRHRTLSVRTVAVALAVAQATLAIPVSARGSGTPGSAERRLTAAPLPAPEVTVNRTVPAVTPPAAAPVFSDKPTIEEVFRARVFGEPLVPVGRTPGNEETTALASAMQAFHRGGGGNLPIFDSFLAAHPESPWRASLLANIGVVEARSHAYTRAFEALEGAWQLAKDSTEPRGKAVADFAVAE